MNVANLAYLERLYADYLRDRDAVPEQWRRYIEGPGENGHFALGPSLPPSSIFRTSADTRSRMSIRSDSSDRILANSIRRRTGSQPPT